jgi:hypothetical protein
MAVNGAVMAVAEPANRKGLGGALGTDLSLECFELGCVAEAEAIDEDGRAGIAIRIGDRRLHAAGQPLRWAATMRRMRSSGDNTSRSNSAARRLAAGDSSMPSMALILAKRSRPRITPLVGLRRRPVCELRFLIRESYHGPDSLPTGQSKSNCLPSE